MTKILLKENVLCAIKVIRENKKRLDCQSICDYIHKFTDSKTRVDYLHLVIQSLVDDNNIVNKPTKRELPSYYIINEMSEVSSDKESEADSINENPIIFDHLGEGVIVYVCDDIPNKQFIKHRLPEDIEGVFVEVNLRKTKSLIFEAYRPPCQSVEYFFKHVGFALDTDKRTKSFFLLEILMLEILNQFCLSF